MSLRLGDDERRTLDGDRGNLHRKLLLTLVRFGEVIEADRLFKTEESGQLIGTLSKDWNAPNEEGTQRMDHFGGRTVTDEADGYALIAERQGNHPVVGEISPDFELWCRDRSGTVRLSSFRGHRPVVLVFGSLT